jgi:hypothetical protein
VSAQQVKDAPNIALHGGELSQADESALYHHYQLNRFFPANRIVLLPGKAGQMPFARTP